MNTGPSANDSQVVLSKRTYNALLRRVDTYRKQANLDPLTGVLNRVGFEARLRQLLAGYMRGSEPSFAYVLADAIGFGRLNDDSPDGHLRGDRAVVDLFQSVKATLRATDVLGRFGGDEAQIILRNVSSEEHLQLALSRLRGPFIVRSGRRAVAVRMYVAGAVIKRKNPHGIERVVHRRLRDAKRAAKAITVEPAEAR